MKKAESWMVELGVHKGPLVFVSEHKNLLQGLREHRIGVDSLTFDGPSNLSVPSGVYRSSSKAIFTTSAIDSSCILCMT